MKYKLSAIFYLFKNKNNLEYNIWIHIQHTVKDIGKYRYFHIFSYSLSNSNAFKTKLGFFFFFFF